MNNEILQKINEYGISALLIKKLSQQINSSSTLGKRITLKSQQMTKSAIVKNLGLNKQRFSTYNLLTASKGIPNKVWVCWWTGEHTLPPICKLCIASMNKQFGSANVTLITKENVGKYVDIDSNILKRLETNSITIQTFSDLLRAKLLYQHGGFWLDATIFVTEKPSADENQDFFSIKRAGASQYVSNKNWTAFALGSSSKNPVFKFLSDMFEQHFAQNSTLLDYFLVDYLIAIAYENIEVAAEQIDSLPINSLDCYQLLSNLNQPFDSEKYNNICHFDSLHKLNWKSNPPKNIQSTYHKLAELVE
ncbi:capsular polysaccharide synthesis protein [Glaciecola sp. KUL10]|uniref:capsular polysaccharide synthesis protein n=1 Tax=Glaciecola sp. (strain KUL10) TaxID=2161813 RepID=UPI000D78C411|nr:capsular polysaccharide synthesis protein [Glaciecola sp. KUL10]GBL04850.1 hypothetical protein KUL10_21650 [Glaciecola sp. KUL10]